MGADGGNEGGWRSVGVCAVLSLSALAASLESPLVMLGMKRSDRHLRDGWGSGEGNQVFQLSFPRESSWSSLYLPWVGESRLEALVAFPSGGS